VPRLRPEPDQDQCANAPTGTGLYANMIEPTLKVYMKLNRLAQSLLLSTLLVSGTAVLAQVSDSIHVGPPPPMYEPIPMMAPGYVWAPGYWAWNSDRHIWMRGRAIVHRTGYRWEPDRWDQGGNGYYRHPGSWARDSDVRPVQVQKFNK
jgi:hypothetical protein